MPTYGTIGKSISKFNVLNNIPILLAIKYDIWHMTQGIYYIEIYTKIVERHHNVIYKNE